MDFAPQVDKLEVHLRAIADSMRCEFAQHLQTLCQSPRVCKSGEVQTFGCSLLPLPLLLLLFLLPSIPSTTNCIQV